MNFSVTDHPLGQTFAHIHQLNQYIGARLGTPTEAGWVTPAELLAPGSIHLAALINTTQTRLHTKAANTISGALLQEYQWPLISTAVACFLVDRRVPDLQPASVYLRLPTAEQGERADEDHITIAYSSHRFVALPHDPAANHPDATLVPDLDTLRNALRGGLESHFAWVIEQLNQRMGCKPRGLWLYVTDRLAGTLSWLMQAQHKTCGLAQLEPEFNALLRSPNSPLMNKKVGFFELLYKEETHIYLDRATCCYWYKTDGGDYCTTCPHWTKAERNARLLAQLAQKYELASQGDS